MMFQSIRSKTLSLTAIMLLFLAGVAGRDLWNAWHARQEATMLRSGSEVRNVFVAGLVDLSLERSLSQLAVTMPGPAGTKVREMIAEQRRIATAKLEKALNLARTMPKNDEVARFIRALEHDLAFLAKVRGEVDQFSALPLERRPADRVKQIPWDIKNMVGELMRQRFFLRGVGHNINGTLAAMENLQDRIWEAREYAGRERTYLAFAVATGLGLNAVQRQEMQQDHARALNAFQVGEIEAVRLRSEPALGAAVAVVQKNYFGSYMTTREALLRAAADAKPDYRVSFDEFFVSSEQVLSEVTKIAILAGEGIEKLWADRLGEATMGMAKSAAILAMAMILGAFQWLLLTRGALSRFDKIRETMTELAAGHLDVVIPDLHAKDEVGAMAAAVRVFKDGAIDRARLETESAAAAERAAADKRGAMNALADGFETSVNRVVESVTAAAEQMLSTAHGMSEAARHALDRATEVASASEQATNNVESVAEAAEQMSRSLAEVSARVTDSANMTGNAAQEAAGASAQVDKLAQSARTIGDVVKLISAIAEQTNLLALNATIEAARAGDAGRGFAIVASEVKNLASQTARATEQIAQQITRMQNETTGVVGAIGNISRLIETLNASATTVATNVEEQNATTREIARSTSQAADGTRHVSSNIAVVSSSVSETGSASDQVLEKAKALSREAGDLRAEVVNFLARVRAA
jgi:methyl-accepting chemotaxis protein